MLQSDLNIIMDGLRSILGTPGLAAANSVRHLRGKITFDCAAFQITDHVIADGLLVGTAFSVPIFRDAALADGIYEYYDAEGNLLKTNA